MRSVPNFLFPENSQNGRCPYLFYFHVLENFVLSLIMRYKYTLIYQVKGIIIPDGKRFVLLEDSTHQVIAFLSNNLDDYCVDIDRRAVIAKRMLSGLGGGSFESHIEEAKKQRINQYKTPPFLIIEAIGEDRSFVLKDEKDYEDYIVCLQNDSSTFDNGQYQNLINGVLSSLWLNIDTFYKFKKVGEIVVYFSNNRKPIYNMALSFKGSGYSSRNILDAEINTIKICSEKLFLNEAFNTICRLLNQSLDSKSDSLLAFLSSWTALEVFVNKTFKNQKQKLIKNLIDHNLLDEEMTGEIERDKFSLTTKFEMICINLNNSEISSDMDLFKRLKKSRDDLFHGDEIVLDSLPTHEAQNLLRKYLGM